MSGAGGGGEENRLPGFDAVVCTLVPTSASPRACGALVEHFLWPSLRVQVGQWEASRALRKDCGLWQDDQRFREAVESSGDRRGRVGRQLRHEARHGGAPRTRFVSLEGLLARWGVRCGCGWSRGRLSLCSQRCGCPPPPPGDTWGRFGLGAFAFSDACNCSPGHTHTHACTHTQHTCTHNHTYPPTCMHMHAYIVTHDTHVP